MAITITVDNDRSGGAAGIQPLLADETSGVQTLAGGDDGNEVDITLSAEVNGTLGGSVTAFTTYLNSLGLSDTQKIFARDHDGASSSLTFIQVTTTENETVNDLFFSDANGMALNGDQVVGMQTLDGQNVYLYNDGTFGSSGDFAVAVTHDINGDPDEVVAAFYLNENTTDHKSAQVQMVVFEPLLHPNAADPDDALNFTDVLRVSAAGSLTFNLDGLPSGNSLWAAKGTASGAVLITSNTVVVDGAGKKTNGNVDITTSQGGDGATVGIGNQLFDNAGETGVFTLVTGLNTVATDDDVTGDYVVDPDGNPPGGNNKNEGIDYNGYINANGAGIYLSQSQGTPTNAKHLDINVLRADANLAVAGLQPEEGFGYASGLASDTPVNVTTVTIFAANSTTPITWVLSSPTGSQLANGATHASGVKITISGNNIDVEGVFNGYQIHWTTATGDTFNRFSVKAEANANGEVPPFDIGKIFVSQAIPGAAAVGDKLFVEDDGPALSGQSASEKVVEDELSIAAADGDLSTGNSDGDGDSDEAVYSNAELQLTLNGGTDAPPVFELNLNATGVVKKIDGTTVTSLGEAVEYEVDGNGVIWGMADGRAVFKLWQSAGAATNTPSDDEFSIDLLDQVDHPNDSGDTALMSIDLTPAFKATDADGDPVDLDGSGNNQKTIRLNIENDVPILSGQTSTKKVVEDELSVAAGDGDLSTGITDNDGDSDQATYNYADFLGVVTVGGDEPINIAMNTAITGAVLDVDGNPVTSKGEAVTFVSVGAGQTNAVAPGGRIVFTVTRTSGSATPESTDDIYTVDLRDQIDHAASGDNGTLTIDLAPLFLISDFDGDDLDLDGPNNDLSPIALVVENDVPALSGQPVSKRVEEDELSTTSAPPVDGSNGITDGDLSTDEVTYTNADLQAAVTAGADEAASFDLNLLVSGAVKDIDGNAMTSKGAAINWSVNGSIIEAVASGRVIFTIAQTAGALTATPTDDVFTVDLRDQIDHPDNSGDLGIETINLTPAFLAADFDGDAVDLSGGGTEETIQLVVENDVPVVNTNVASIQVDEDAMTGAAGSDLSTGIVEADDGDGGVENDEATWTNAALQTVIATGADEPVNFTLNTGLSGGLDGSAVLGTDGLAVYSKGQQVFYNVNGSVVEGVADGRVVFTITQTTGSGSPLDPTDDVFTFDLKDQIDHAANGDLGTRTLDLTAAFAAEDYDGDAVDLNGTGNDRKPIQVVVENDVPILSGANITKHVDEDNMRVADSDGSNGNEEFGAGGIDIDDGDGTVGEQDEVSYSQADLQGVITFGADEPVLFMLNSSASGAVMAVNPATGATTAATSKGQAVTWKTAAGVIQGVTGASTPADLTDDRIVFSITRNANGAGAEDDTFTFNLLDQVDHTSLGDLALLTLDITPAFAAADFDGDAVDLNGANNDQEPIRVRVENDVPLITAQILDGAVDFVSSDSVTNSLNGAIGADDNSATSLTSGGLKQYVITSFSEPKNVFANLDGVLSADGTKVTYYSTNVAANQNASTAVYELSLNQTANSGAGSYTFTVLQPPPQQVVNLDFTDLPSGQNFHGTIAIDKTDLSDGGLLVFASNADINDGEDGEAGPPPLESTDGTMTSESGTVNTSKGGGPVTIGNGNQAFENNIEGAWFVYVDNPAPSSVAGVGLDQNNADDADNVLFDGTVEVRKASVEIVQASGKGTIQSPGPGMQVKAYDLNPGTVGPLGGTGVDTGSRAFVLDPDSTGIQVNIVGAKIYNSSGVLIEYRTNTGSGATNSGTLMDSGDAGTTVTTADDSLVDIQFFQDSTGIYSIKVNNLKANYTIEWETTALHDAALTQHLAGSYDIGGFNLLLGQDTPDQLFDFSVRIADYDGDQDGGVGDAFAEFSVLVDGTGVNNDPVVG